MGGAELAKSLITLAGAIFIFPFFILSAIGGEIADRYDKSIVAQRLKLAEIARRGHRGRRASGSIRPTLLFAALFLIGVIAALFGPIKYGILPDHLAENELPAGNALVEGATFIAILTGTIVAGFASKDGGEPGLLRRADDGVCARLLGLGAVHPAHRRSGAEPCHRLQHRALDLRRCCATSTPNRGCGGAASW